MPGSFWPSTSTARLSQTNRAASVEALDPGAAEARAVRRTVTVGQVAQRLRAARCHRQTKLGVGWVGTLHVVRVGPPKKQ